MGVNLSEFKSVEMNMTAPRTWTIEQVKDWLTECFGLNPEVHTVGVHALWTKSITNILWYLRPVDDTSKWVSWLKGSERRGTNPVALVLPVAKEVAPPEGGYSGGGGYESGQSSQAPGGGGGYEPEQSSHAEDVYSGQGDGYSGEDGEVDGDEENGYRQNQMEEEDTEGESDAGDSDESDDGEEVPIPGRWNHNFSSAMTINDGLDSNWEYHQNNVAVGAMFPSKRHMQDAIIKWAMASQRQLRTTVSSGKYLTMECVDINCPGRVHGYVPKYDTTWRVSDFVPHSCELASIRNDHCNLSSNLIARLLYTEIVEGQAMRVNAIQKNVKKHHFYTISYGKAWRAKQRAMEMRFGSFRDAYDAVVRLLQTLQARNPDTYVNIQDMFLPEFPSYREFTKQQVVQRKAARDANIAAHMQAVAAGTTAVEAPVYEAPQGLCDLPGFDPPGTRRRQGRQIKNFEQWIEHEPTERWSLLHDTHGARYGVMTTNLAESYNFVLRGNRALPLTAIVEGIFMGTVKYYRERREKARMHMVNKPATPYCSKIMEYMHKKKEKAKHLAVVQIGNVERRFEVRLPTDRFGCGNPQRTHDVKIGNEEWPTCECTCNKPKLLHLPCSHVLAVCGVLGMSEISFVSPYYLKEAVLNTWTGELEGFRSMGNFNTVNPGDRRYIPDPTLLRTGIGRRPSQRIRNDMDESEAGGPTRQCFLCNQFGHWDTNCTTFGTGPAGRGQREMAGRSLLSRDVEKAHRAAKLEASPNSLPTLVTRGANQNWQIHPGWVQRLKWAGLLPFARLVEATMSEVIGERVGTPIKRLQYDHSLLTSLVDRWRPETHTFHFRWGEMAPTLQDVSYLLGLPLAGRAIGPLAEPVDWDLQMPARFEGIRVGQPDFLCEDHGPKCDWLLNFEVSQFTTPMSEAQITRSLEAYLMWLLGKFDVLDDRAVIWEPYTAAAVHARYPGGISILCYRDCAYWMTQSKIIFDVSVEVMAQQRIMRQFGSRQLVDPPPPIAPLPAYVHKYNRKGTSHSSTWWLQRVGSYVDEWLTATTHLWRHDEQFDPQEFEAYLQRYTAAARVRLIPPIDPAEAPPPSMYDMYPTQSTAGSRQHAGQMTSDLHDEVARYTRQVSSGPLLQPRDQQVSWLRRLEEKLRGIYSAITCSRSSDVVQRHLLPPRPSTRHDPRPRVTPTRHPDHHLLTGREVRRGSSTPSFDDFHGQQHGSRPRLTPTATPRPPPPEQAGGSSWQQQQHTPSFDDFHYYQQQAAFDEWQQQQAPFMGGGGYSQGYTQHTASNPSWGASDQDTEHMEYYSTQQNYVGMQTPPPLPTQETQYDPESGSWIPARNVRAPDRFGWTPRGTPPPRQPRLRRPPG
ncbi:hypothetical protein QYE76_010827 [Lolium multiflorum]|uniref:SWIM-type domain-containing protein n=1 Tax=Lolium multiflorum TaxID=4521 RepID=A0AAD8X3G8_LOLMU|nr:hypothetical protein QYE76_010827 [Lolium multiflorum]